MNVDQFVEQYEKKYQKLERIRTIVVMVMAIIVVVVIFGCGFFGLKMGWVILILAMIAFLASILINIAQQFNANTIAEKWMNDLDMDFALEVYRKLTEKFLFQNMQESMQECFLPKMEDIPLRRLCRL